MDFQTIATTVVTSGIVSSLATLGLQTYLKGRINHHFNEKLASFNEQIMIQAERRKLDLDRKIHDFSLYSKKRHELYPELYRYIYKANHDLRSIQGHVFISTHSFKSPEKILASFENMSILLNQQFIDELNNLYNQLGSNREEYIRKVRFFVRDYFLSELSKELNVLEKFYSENLLYFSDTVSDKANLIIHSLYYASAIITDEGSSDLFKEPKHSNLIDELDKYVKEFKGILKEELSVGDYSNKIAN
ncbi:hypothetical protein [Priestia megaterium]|uniref:hypothetical protein n=1 Tax=Priestia megaterium TaxID=1404 RepID=UPI00372D6498